MKPTGQRWKINNEFQLNALNEWVKERIERGETTIMQMMKEDRTGSQNNLIYHLYGQIARQAEDKSVLDVKRECKLYYGIPILRACNPEFCQWYDRSLKGLNLEDKLLLMTYMDVTSLFDKDQATEYLNTIIVEYTRQGYVLDDPRAA